MTKETHVSKDPTRTVEKIEGTITMKDGTVRSFYFGTDFGWSQWGETPTNLGNSVDVLEAIKVGLIEQDVQVVSDIEFAAQVMALRTQKEISRESTLDYFGFDQATEAMRRELEEELYDDIFQTQVPFSTPNGPGQQGPNGGPVDPSVSGAQGGRPPGGGTSPQSPQAQTKRRSKTGRNPSTGGS